MPKCSELCPIAKAPEERSQESGETKYGVQYVLLAADTQGTTVIVREDHRFPGIAASQVPPDATPTCRIEEYIAKIQREGGYHATTENCIHVPRGKAPIIVVKK